MTKNTISEDVVREMVQTGMIFGHKKSKTHPNMKPHISGNRNEVELINPASSWESLENAIEFIKNTIGDSGLMLLVGTNSSAKSVIEGFAKEFNFPYVTSRWLGGTLTNFSVIRSRVSYYEGLKEKKSRGDFAKYTKKEQHKFNEEIKKMSGFFEGLIPFVKLPDILFVVDIEEHNTSVREAKRLSIPVVAIVDTDDDPSLISHPIFASDHSRQGIAWIVEKISEAIRAAKLVPHAEGDKKNHNVGVL